MGAWQPLPDDLPPEVRHFVEQLRQLKDRTGLSLVALGARTAYSKSSWQRYLNATQPPPRQAVVALCRVAGTGKEEAERFGVRWELAVQAWPKSATVPAKPEGAEGEGAEGGEKSEEREKSAGHEKSAEHEEYEDDPTLPWWDAPPAKPEPPSRRLLVVAVVLVVALVLTAVIGALALG
ncbi:MULTISPECIES: helix-turn-helix transcriptional regulator [unclassified Streptomyces]|uniref:helix-turn-helix domain-containing protein n=1 Tax=unclassified Streptomyces TaxID=2593676 RepID=UPI0023661C34|nr:MULTISPECIES: helix-turn-helix transcriptional regulator [unclassified Streptomyces]MDF3147530.1 helix-turn-helix transcriptional regulator [Streptomyces sp. T21Q-yed]WDF40711.1 helix-turn-helix transcriptional regulator [Streptomyces sp. T12]